MKVFNNLFAYYLHKRQILFLMAAFMLVCGLLGSRALISISMMVWTFTALVQTELKQDAKRFFRTPELWVLCLFFVVYFFWGLNNEHHQDWITGMRVKLPFLAIPFVAMSMRKYGPSFYKLIFYFFFYALTVSSFVVFAHYLMHYHTINEMMTHGKIIPVPYNHIRYSLMIVFAIIIGLHLYSKRFFVFQRVERILLLLICLWLIIFIHILSVRSGMMVFYLLVFVSVLKLLFIKQYRWRALLILIIMLTGPLIAYYSFDSFHNKVDYTQFDVNRYLSNKSVKGTSDGRRIISIKAGIEVFKSNPWFGAGIGDVRNRLNQIYREKYPDIPDNFIVHNQYVFWLAALGISGFLILVFALFFPLLYKGRFKNHLVLSFFIIMAASLLVESTLEVQIGTALFLFFIPLAINYSNLENNSD